MIEIGHLAILFGLIAAILKLVDWLMLDSQKQRLGEELHDRLDNQHPSFLFMAKTPILALDKILSAALIDPRSGKTSWRRVTPVSSLLLMTCLVSAGLLTDSTLGFKKSPGEAYNQEIKIFEKIINNYEELNELSDEQEKELIQFHSDMKQIIETAKHPFARWVSLLTVSILIILVSITFTNFSLYLTAKITKAISTTDQPVLLAGAILLNGCGSLVIFVVELVFLSIASSIFLLFIFSFMGILFELGLIWGPAAFTGYGIFTWLSSPIWLKALATASIIPFLLMLVAVGLTALIFPIRKPLFYFIRTLLKRMSTHRDGPIAFMATSFFLLFVVITLATRFINWT